MAADALTAAGERHRAGVDLQNRGRPARALRTLTGALALIEAVDGPAQHAAAVLSARIRVSMALCEADMRGVAAGRQALARAADLARELGDPTVSVALHTQAGLIEFRFGDMRQALVEYDAAARLIEHAAPHIRLSIHLSRGALHLQLGHLGDARRDLAEAARIAGELGFGVGRFKALHNLAYLEFLDGDLPLALKLMDEAGSIDADVSRGIWLLDRARVLSEAGLGRDADDDLAAAAVILRKDRLVQDLAETELERARCALARDDPAAARQVAAAARDRFRRRGNDRWRRSAELVLLQADLAAGRPGARLVAPAQRLRADLAAEGLRLPARAAGLIAAQAELAAGRPDAAAAVLAEVGPARRGDPITGRLHSHYVHARVDAARGRIAPASRRIRRALDELAGYQSSFGSIDLRTASAVHGRRLAELDLTLALATGRPVTVFAAAERARAVSSRLPTIRPPDDPVAAELLAELRQNVEALRAVELDRAASGPLLRRRRDLERRIAARSWTTSGSGAAARAVPVGAVRDRLGEVGATMVVYVPAGAGLAAVVVGAGVRVVDLGPSAPVIERVRRVRADLDVLAHPKLVAGIRAAVRASLERSLRELDAALLAPLDVDGPLVVVSTGVLGQLPWASVPSMRGRPVVVVPSATKWFGSAGPAPGRPATAVVAIAGPDLARADDEAGAVAATWRGARLLTGAAATAPALAEAMRGAGVLHVAAHGVHQPENPLFSSVRMVDGPVFAHELDLRAHAPEHVVLSACEVGVATVRPGDEALGLASVLLQLGTRSVVAGVARVGDDVAARTMIAYHAKLAAGRDSATALAEALAQVDADVPPPFVNFGAAWTAGPRPA